MPKRLLQISVTVFLLLIMIHSSSAAAVIEPDLFADYNHYLQYINQQSLPDRFVEYVDLKDFGKYVYFEDSYTTDSDTYYYYCMYSFVDQNEFRHHLLISHGEQINLGGKTYFNTTPGMGSMRHLESERSGSIRKGDLEYVYTDGYLTYILWQIDGIYFALGGVTPLSEYPADGAQTLICDLLSLDNAKAGTALARLMVNVPGSVQPSHDTTAYLMHKLMWVVAIAVVAVGYVVIRTAVVKHRQHWKNTEADT